MNWKRVTNWTLLLIAATFVGGFIPGVINGFYGARGATVPAWPGVLQAVLVPSAIFTVFFFFTRMQRERTVSHVAALWAAATVISLLNMALGMTFGAWLLSALFSVVIAAVAAGLGIATTAGRVHSTHGGVTGHDSPMLNTGANRSFPDRSVDPSPAERQTADSSR